MKTTPIRFRHTASGRVMVTRCHNLRRDSAGRLTPVDPPATVAVAIRRPLVYITTSDSVSHAIVETRDGAVGVIVGARPGDTAALARVPQTLAHPDTAVRDAVAGTDRVTVFTDGVTLTLYHAPDEPACWLASTDMPDIPGISLTARDVADLETRVAPCTLSGTYSQHNRTVNAADKARVDASLSDAYRTIASQARAADVFCQPVMAACRLYDRSGNIVYTSAPVLLQPSSGTQLGGTVDMQVGDDGTTLAGTTVTARGYRIALCIPTALPRRWANLISRAEVCVSPQIHPYDPKGTATHTMTYGGSAGLTLHSSLRGHAAGLSAADASASHRLLQNLAAAFDDMAQPLYTLRDPFGGTTDPGTIVDIVKGAPTTLDDELAAVKSLSRRRPRAGLSPELRHAAMSATTAVRSGAATFYANPSFTTFAGFRPADYAVAVDPARSWQAFAKVTLDDGDEVAVATGSGTTGAPVALSPVVMYPSARAVSFTFTVRSGTEVRSVTLPLIPVEDAGIAVGCSDDLRPVQLPVVAGMAYDVPDAVTRTHTYSGFVAAGHASDPGVACCLGEVSPHPLATLMRAPSPSGAWDYGRARVYALAADGCSVVVVERGLTSLAAGGVMHADLSSATLVAPADSGIYVADAATGTISLITGRTVREVARLPHAARRIGAIVRDPVRNELWCIPPLTLSSPLDSGLSTLDSSCATVLNLDNPAEGYTADITPVARVCHGAGPSLALLADGVLADFAATSPADEVEAQWQAVVTDIPRSRMLTLHATGTPAQCHIALTRSHINTAMHTLDPTAVAPASPLLTATVLDATVSGTLLAPLCLPLLTPPSSSPLTITLTLTASDDFTLSDITLT